MDAKIENAMTTISRKGISGSTICLPLIGHPVEQVKSPAVINGYFEQHDIDAVMFPVDLVPSLVPGFFALVRGWSNCGGVSVTVPYKQTALACVDEVSERAQRIGAVNTVRRDPSGHLVGDNTDGIAFVSAVKARGTQIAGAHCLVIGAGAAGSAIAHALAEAGAGAISVLDIDAQRRQALATSLAGHYHALRVQEGFERGDDPAIVINASTLGMHPDDAFPFDLDRIDRRGLAADVVTKPVITPFLTAALKRGWQTQTGEDMAVAQLGVQTAFLGVERYRRTAAKVRRIGVKR